MLNKPIQLQHVPENVSIENEVLANLIMLGDSKLPQVQEVMLKLNPECFYKLANRIIFDVIRQLFSESKLFTAVDLTHMLSGPHMDHVWAILSNCIGKLHSQHVDTLCSVRNLRAEQAILVNTLNATFHEPDAATASDTIRKSLQQLNSIASTTSMGPFEDYAQIADELLSETEGDTGLINLNIPGMPLLHNRSLVTIAGRSGHGKSFFAMYLMDKLITAVPGKQTLYFNLEMHKRAMMERHLRMLGVKGVDRKELVNNGIQLLIPKNVKINSSPTITIDEIESQCRIAALTEPVGIIVVDYIGLIRSKAKSESKYLEQGDIAKRLAQLAGDLDCIVMDLIQVNRDFKNKPVGERCPQTSDAAESMGTVHSSSWWIGIDQPGLDSDEECFRDLFQVQCRKNRNEGGLFKLELDFKDCQFSPRLRKFSEYARRSHAAVVEF